MQKKLLYVHENIARIIKPNKQFINDLSSSLTYFIAIKFLTQRGIEMKTYLTSGKNSSNFHCAKPSASALAFGRRPKFFIPSASAFGRSLKGTSGRPLLLRNQAKMQFLCVFYVVIRGQKPVLKNSTPGFK